MDRLIQILQNFFIRFFALISLGLKSIGNFFKSILGFFSGIFGFDAPDYFLESDDSQGIKRAEQKPMLTTEQNTTFEPSVNNRRRTNNQQMDYYRKMAQEIKKG